MTEGTIIKGPEIKGYPFSNNIDDQKRVKNTLNLIKLTLKAKPSYRDSDLCRPSNVDNLISDKIKALLNQSKSYPKVYFKETQNWIGHITEINQNSFFAKLEDVQYNDTFEVAEFDIKDVSQEDRKLMALGSIFYWSVGYAVRGSQVFKESFLRFQRMPPWNVREFDKVADNSAHLFLNLKWD